MTRPRAPRLGLLAASLLLVTGSAVWAPARAGGPTPAVFRVGAATESLTPQQPVYAGGFGASPPIRSVTGALQVRAMWISNGRHAVAFAVVDAQGAFAAYQGAAAGQVADGLDAVRRAAAAAMSRSGPAMTADDVVVQATHSHSAPTLEGIWGPTPDAYLALVRARTVAALARAARQAQPAHLEWAAANAPDLDNIATAQYDSFPGWSQDGQLSVLRAVTPGGATVATYANVPAHPDIVCGACLRTLTADYFGAVREALDAEVGGVSLVSPATLGREETPVQASSLGQMRFYADVVRSRITSALAHPHVVTDPTLGGVGSTAEVPGTNAALLALVAANHLPDARKDLALATAGEYPIDRADVPPYQAGAVVGTPLTALRVGPLAYLSMPGEPFPEVRLNLREAVPGAQLVVALSKAQDDLGYFYPSWVAPFASALYPTDQGTFSVSPVAGDVVLQQQLAGARALGFATRPLAVPAPLPADYAQALRPGLQALAAPGESDAGAVTTLEAFYAPADEAGAPAAGPVTWDLGDGTTARTTALTFGGPCTTPNVAGYGVTSCPDVPGQLLRHRFRPGTWHVTVRGSDTQGHPVSWRLTVVVHPAGRLHVARSAGRMAVTETGGSGRLLAATWTLADGTRVAGTTVPAGPWVEVRAVDSAGGRLVLAHR